MTDYKLEQIVGTKKGRKKLLKIRKCIVTFQVQTWLQIFQKSLNKGTTCSALKNHMQGVKFLFFPIFSYFSQHTPIFPIF